LKQIIRVNGKDALYSNVNVDTTVQEKISPTPLMQSAQKKSFKNVKTLVKKKVLNYDKAIAEH